MTKTATIQSVNGSAASDDRPCGVAVLREMEAKALIHLACDAMHQTSEVSYRIHQVIYRESVTGKSGDLVRQIMDALVCLQAAEHYLGMLRDVLAEQASGTVDPWTAEPAF